MQTLKLISSIFSKKREGEYGRRIKAYFRAYFNTDPFNHHGRKAEYATPLHKLGITGMDVKLNKNKLILTVTLEHPGVLIGPGARTINSVTEYIQARLEKSFTIKVKESNIWK